MSEEQTKYIITFNPVRHISGQEALEEIFSIYKNKITQELCNIQAYIQSLKVNDENKNVLEKILNELQKIEVNFYGTK